MKLLSWNILHGASSRGRSIADFITRTGPDIVTLQEFRPSTEEITRTLKNLGLKYIHIPATTAPGQNTILIASRFAFDAGDFMPEAIQPVPILEAAFNAAALGFPLSLLAAHFPQKEPQVPLFKQLLTDTPSLLDGEILLIGDLNCGIPFADSMTKTFFATEYFQDMLAQGWIDCWRSRHKDAVEYSWYSTVKKHGFRYDQALASKSFDRRITTVRYDHAVRQQGLSDHSAMIVEFS